MKKAIKKRWVEALRSGEYEQGRMKLRNKGTESDTFCCLGVLCDLAVQDGAIPEPKRYGDSATFFYGTHNIDDGDNALGYIDSTTALPQEVIEWAFTKRETRSKITRLANPTAGERDLAWWNDHGNKDFNGIADLIEEQL